MSVTLATYLTLLRLILGSALMPLLIVYVLPYNIVWLNYAVAAIYILLSFTDFLDGFIARLYKQETVLGQRLDLLADKLLTCSIFVALAYTHRVYFIVAFIFIGRDIFMQGLRLLGHDVNIAIPVAWWGKLRLLIINMYIATVLANPDYMKGFADSPWNQVERVLLIVSLVGTLIAAYAYVKKLQKGLDAQEKMAAAAAASASEVHEEKTKQ